MKILYTLILFSIAIFLPEVVLASAWKLNRAFWTDQDEKAYSDFVERICDSKYGNLNKFIRDSKVNPFYGEEDKNIYLNPDCADLPYLVRAYVAYKLRLPFSYVSEISGKGGDERYSKGNKPVSFKDQDYFSTPQQLFSQITLVNSGYFRMDVNSESSDHYPIKISHRNLTPGTIYYDPDGHVALVAKVLDNGRIRLIDAHPDKSISKPWFGSKFSRGNKSNGGGFKKWRQIRYTSDGKIVRTKNHNLRDYSSTDQYEKSYSINGKNNVDYYDYVRFSLTKSNGISDPMADFIFMMQDIYEDIKYRAVAVEIAINKGCHLKPHPEKLPYNIYGTDGIWEELSTPSRDARLKVAFREFYDTVRRMILNIEQVDARLAKAWAYNFLLKYDELSQKFCIAYTNSAGNRIILNFAEINRRLFDLSFDPYHSIEYRWGASGQELATANDGETKRKFYDLERRLRNQLERVYGCHTPLSMGPENHVAVNIRDWLYAYINGNKIDREIVAFNKEIISNQDIEKGTVKTEDKPNSNAIKEEKAIQIAMVENNKQEQTSNNSSKADYVTVSFQNKEVNSTIINRTPVNIPLVVKNDNINIPKEQIKSDFWSDLLIEGDKFAAKIGNINNYNYKK